VSQAFPLQDFLNFRLAFLFWRALAAALDALVAISLRFLALNFLALASPPLRPISDNNSES
jgi:hypothetical protein